MYFRGKSSSGPAEHIKFNVYDAYHLGKIRVLWVECSRSIPGGVTVAQRFLVPLVGVRISTGKHNGAALQPHFSFSPRTYSPNFWDLTALCGPVRVVA